MDLSEYYANVHYSDNVKNALKLGEKFVYKSKGLGLGGEAIIYGFLRLDCRARDILNSLKVTADNYLEVLIRETKIYDADSPTLDVKAAFRFAEEVAMRVMEESGDATYYVFTETLLYALIPTCNTDKTCEILRQLRVDPDELRLTCLEEINTYCAKAAFKNRKDDVKPLEENVQGKIISESSASSSDLPEALSEFGIDLTFRAYEKKLDPVIGREKETDQVIQILSRRTKNNPVLTGEPGVGKSAVIEGLAQAIVNGDVPQNLNGKTIYSLDLASVVAGTHYRGDFEERLKKIVEVVKKRGDIIMFIDEIHNIIGAGAADGTPMDASNILKPMLARGELQIVGATTIEEYRKYIEKDPALERRFTPVNVAEPSIPDAINILKGLREKYEIHHNVKITDEAVEAAVRLSDRYINDRYLPDKAIDLIDEGAAKIRLRALTPPESFVKMENEIKSIELRIHRAKLEGEEAAVKRYSDLREDKMAKYTEAKGEWERKRAASVPKLTQNDVADVVAERTGIPLSKINTSETQRLLNLEDTLHRRIIGQDEAIKAVASAIRRARAGIKDPSRPIGSFIFVGPTGVGKTDLTKALAGELFGNEKQIIRLDMSEFMEKQSVAKLIGAPPGYAGFDADQSGLLTEKVRRSPYSIVLFDEIEKAHPDVFNVLLQILDDGRLTDSKGRVVNFKNCVIVLTSNIGASETGASKPLGFGAEKKEGELSDYDEMKERITDALKRNFRPEFLNRIDEIIVFHSLTKEQVSEICGKMIDNLSARMRQNGMDIVLSPEAIEKIVDEGYTPAYGARPLKRVIQRRIEDRLSDEILLGNVKRGERVTVTVKNGELWFSKERFFL